MIAPTSAFCRTPALSLHYRRWQQGDRRVLLLHGLGDLGLVWQGLTEHLSECDLVAPDLRGHGLSDKPDQGYDSATVIDDLEALLGHLGWHDCDVIAHSWTAKVALIWAAREPGRIRSLTLIDPFFLEPFPRWTKFTFPLLYRTLPFLRLLGPFPDRKAAETCARQLKQYRDWSPLQQQVFEAAVEQKPDATWGSRFCTAARDGVFEACLFEAAIAAPLETPVLLLLPEQGLNRSRRQIRSLLRHARRLQIRTIPGNHWAHLTQPLDCAVILDTFLTEISGS